MSNFIKKTNALNSIGKGVSQKLFALFTVLTAFSWGVRAQAVTYCTPVYDNTINGQSNCGVYGIDIKNFKLVGEAGTAITNMNTACEPSGYKSYMNLSTTLYKDYSYNALLSSHDNQGMNRGAVAIWIDFNDDGDFDSDEMVASNYFYGSYDGAISFYIPDDAPTGTHRMRVMLAYSEIYNGGAGPWYFDPCTPPVFSSDPNATSAGETNDYTVNIQSAPDCVNAPNAGNAFTNNSNVCSSQYFNVNTNVDFPHENGLSGIWQSSLDGVNWTDIAGATGTQYTNSGITVNTNYRYNTTCSFSGATKYSTVTLVTVRPEAECYYQSNYSGYQIENVKLNGETISLYNSSSYNQNQFNYQDFTSGVNIPDLAIDSTYSLFAKINDSGVKFGAWIDFNNDGVFDDITESIGYISPTSNYFPYLQNFQIPTNATLGQVKMRVRSAYYSWWNASKMTPTSTENYGNTEDYLVNIIQISNSCSGTPNAGTASAPAAVCTESDFALSLTGVSTLANGLSGTWQSSPAGANTWENIPYAKTHTYTVEDGITSATDYRYVLTCATSSTSDTSNVLSVSVNTLPTIDLGTETFFCTGTTMVLDAGNVGSTYLWEWETDYGYITSTNQKLVVSEGNWYGVTVTDANGCVNDGSISINEVTQPLPVVNLGIDTSYCHGTAFTATLNAGNAGANYTWNDNSVNQTLAVTTAGTYSVKVTNMYGCTVSDTLVVTENALPFVNLGLDTAICAGTTLTLNAGNAGATYTWNNSSANQTVAVTTAGTYSVAVKNANNCVAKDTIVISVNALPTIGTLSYTGGEDCAFNFGVTSPANVSNYAWTFGDSQTASTTVASTSHTYAVAGTYTVSVKASNACGNVTKTVDVSCEKTGVEDVALANRLTLYPNPTSSDVTIEVAGDVTMKDITIIDNLGKVIYQSDVNNAASYQMNVSDLSNGLYTAIITTDKGNVMKKFEVMK